MEEDRTLRRLENQIHNLVFELMQTNQALLELSQRINALQPDGTKASLLQEQQIMSRIGRLRAIQPKKQ